MRIESMKTLMLSLFLVFFALPACASELPVSPADQKAWLELRHALQVEAKRKQEAKEVLPAGQPARPLTPAERDLVLRVVKRGRNFKSHETMFHGQVVDGDTGKPIAGATIAAETYRAGGRIVGDPITTASDAQGLFSLTGSERFDVTAKDYLSWGVRKVEMPLVSEMMLPEEGIAAYADHLAAHLHEDSAPVSQWNKFVVGERVELVKNDPQDLDVRVTALACQLRYGQVWPAWTFVYKPEDCPKDVYRNRSKWDPINKRLLPLPDRSERKSRWCSFGLVQTPELKQIPSGKEMEKRPDWEKELLRLRVDVDAIRKLGGGVLMLCDTEQVDKDGKSKTYVIGQPQAADTSAAPKAEGWRIATVEYLNWMALSEAANFPRTPAGYVTEAAQETEEFRKFGKMQDAELRDQALRRWKKPGIYPRRTRLVVIDGKPGDGIQSAPIRYFNPIDAGPQPEKQLRRAPVDGYRREWVIGAEEMALARGESHPFFAYVRLNGFYGRVRLVRQSDFGLDYGGEVDAWKEAVKMEATFAADARPSLNNAKVLPPFGVYGDAQRFYSDFQFSMQDDGGRNLLSILVDGFSMGYQW